LLAETANAPPAEAEDVKEPKPEVPARPADADPAAQPIRLRSQQALKKTPATAEEVYRDLVSRYPRTEGELRRSSGIAKEKEGVYSDAKLATECSDWRQFIARYRGDEREGDARYRLALCSIETFERSPSDANRQRAMEDGTSYLDVATDEERAERIRRALEQLRP